jgi:two-component system copper resistance phosphate regulon response regulator CusR
VIEDEPRMRELLRRGLQELDCAVMTAMDGETGLEIASGCEFDAIVLDIGLPRCDGYDVLRTLRARSNGTRVLMLTARDGEDEIIRGLDSGADDYLTKPFSFAEFVARLQSIIRHARPDAIGVLKVGDLEVDPVKRLATRGNKRIELSRSEFHLLIALVRGEGECVPRRSLMDSIWGSNCDVSGGALDVLVNSLRCKIEIGNRPKLIHTVRGFGYLLGVAEPEREHAGL